MIKKYLKFLLVPILFISLGTMALAIRDVTPAKPIVNPVTQTLYVVDNTVPQIKVYGWTSATWSNAGISPIALATGSKCYGMAVNSAGTKLYISVSAGSASNVIFYNLDGSGLPTGGAIALTGAPWFSNSSPAGMALDESRNRLYVADKGSYSLRIFDISTDTYVKRITSTTPYFDVVALSDKVYVSNKSATGRIDMYTYSGSDLTLGTPITGISYPTYMKAVNGNLYVAVQGSDGVDIKVYNTADNSVVGSVKNGAVTASYGWTGFDITSDGTWLVYKRSLDSFETSNKLYKIKISDISDPVNPVTATEIGTVNKSDGAALSFDRTKAALSDSLYGSLYIVGDTGLGNHKPANPNPADIKQMNTDDDSIITTGGTAHGNQIKVSFTISDSDGDPLTPIVQYRPVGNIDPSATVTVDLPVVNNTSSPVTVTATLPASGVFDNGGYKWRVAAKDAQLQSAWLEYNDFSNMSNPDFVINTASGSFEIQWTSPTNGATGVAVNTPIVVKFTRPVNTSSFSMTIAPNVALTYSWSEGNSRVTAMHAANFAVSQPYNVTVAAQDTNGNALTGPNTFSFTTSPTTNTAPYIIQTYPTDGATAVFVDDSIVITFSQAINPATLQYTSTPDPTGWNVSWNGTSTVATLKHNNFSATTGYSFEVTAATGANGVSLVQGPPPNPFHFTTGPGGKPILNQNIKRDSDTSGGSVTITWDTNPAGSGVDIYTLTCTYDVGSDNYTSYYTTDPSKWTKTDDNVTIGTKTFQNRVGQGTAEYYKIVLHGATLQSSDLNKADVLGKFDIAVGPSETQPNRFFVSVPLVPIAPKTSALADMFGTQVTDGDSILTFNMNKDVISGSTYSGGTWAAFTGVPAVSSINLGRCYGYLTQTAKFISVIGSLPTTANALNLTGGWDQTNDRPAVAEWISNAFPALVRIQDSGLTDATSKGTSPLDAGTVYQFTSNADLIVSNDSGITYNSVTGWLNGSGNPSTFYLIPGKGFMLTEPKKATFTWTQPVPY